MPSMSAYFSLISFFCKCTVYARYRCIVCGIHSTRTVALLLLVCTGSTMNISAVSVCYYSSKNVYSIVCIILRLHGEYDTVLRLIDGTKYSTTRSLESRYGKRYHFANPWCVTYVRTSSPLYVVTKTKT